MNMPLNRSSAADAAASTQRPSIWRDPRHPRTARAAGLAGSGARDAI